MDNFDDLKNLWQQLPTQSLASAREMNQKASHYQRTMKRKYIFSIACLAATLIFIGIIGYLIEPQYVTTRIGVVVIIVAIVISIIAQGQLIQLLSPAGSPELDSRQYLQQMIAYRQKLKRVQTTGMSLYFLLLSLGLGLYMTEYVLRMDLWMRAVTVSLTAGWIGFAWFYLRPRQIKKQTAKTDEMIDQLENVSRQL